MPAKLPVNDIVVMLPGILGSVLEQDGKEVWAISKGAAWRGLTTLGKSIKRLELHDDDPDKPFLDDGVRATRLMPDVHLLPGFWKIDGYSGIKHRLFADFDFVDGVNWFDFPYDWRRDNRAAAGRLAESTEQWLSAYRAQPGKADAKLVLLGHSMGGLVARHFLEVLGGWEQTRALVTFGTPYRGSVNALDFLAHGFVKGFGPFKLDLSDMMRSLTSVYQLLPIYPCIDDGSSVTRKIEDLATLPPGVDKGMLTASALFHDDIEAAVDKNGGAGRYQICPVVGIFQPTRQSAVVRDGSVEIGYALDGSDLGGDGTVPRVSATPIELSADAREVYATEAHASLQNVDAVITQVRGILTWQPLDRFRAEPSDGFSIAVDDVVPPHEGFTVTLGTAGPVLSVGVMVENVDTGTTIEATGQLGSDGRATISLPGLAAGIYRITGRDADGVGLRPVTDLFVVADDESATMEVAMSEETMQRSATPAGGLEPVEQPEDVDCPDGDSNLIARGDNSAASRGWGPGWPTNNSSKMSVVRAGGIAVSVHRDIAPLVAWLLDETVRRGYQPRQGECWGFANRSIRNSSKPSNHSWGLAVDINAPANPMTDRLVTDMPSWMPELWKSKQFRWGGDYKGRVDAMHFEFMGTPGDAARHIAELGSGPAPGPVATPQVERPRLRRGATGDHVRHLQQRLNDHGASLAVDGIFGPATDAATRSFQRGAQLEIDGIVGPQTWAALS